MLIGNDSDAEISHDEFNNLIKNSENPIVVHFFAEWCMNCLMLTPIIDDLALQMENIKFLKINIDENQEIATKLNVSKIPCLLIFKKGAEVDRIKGAQSLEVIEEKIKNYL